MTISPPPPPGYLPVANWRVWDIVFVFVAGLVGSVFVGIGLAAGGVDPLDPLPFSMIFAGQAAMSFFVMWSLSRSRGSGSLAADFGLVVRGSDWWGVLAGMVLQVVIVAVTAPLVSRLFPSGPPEQGVTAVAGNSTAFAEQLAIFITVAVAAPIIEEMLYRGMLLSWLRKRMGPWPAVVLSAATFAVVHLMDPSAIAVIPGLFLLGLALGWAALKRGDLSLAIALHSGINLLAVITILYGQEILDWSETQLDQIEGLVRFIGLLP